MAGLLVSVPSVVAGQLPVEEIVAVYRGHMPDEPRWWVELGQMRDGRVAASIVNLKHEDGTIAPTFLLGRFTDKKGRCFLSEDGKMKFADCLGENQFAISTSLGQTPISFVQIPMTQSLGFGTRFPVTAQIAAERCQFLALDHSAFGALPALRTAVAKVRSALPRVVPSLSRPELDRLISERTDLQNLVMKQTATFARIKPLVATIDVKFDPIADTGRALRDQATIDTIGTTIWLGVMTSIIDTLATANLTPPQVAMFDEFQNGIDSCNAVLGGAPQAVGPVTAGLKAAVARNSAALASALVREFGQINSVADVNSQIDYYGKSSYLAGVMASGSPKTVLAQAQARAAFLARAPRVAPAAVAAAAAARIPTGPGAVPNRAAVLSAIVREAQTVFQANPRYAMQRWLEGSSAVSESAKMRENYDQAAGSITISSGDRSNGSYSHYQYNIENVKCVPVPRVASTFSCDFTASIYVNILLASLTIADTTTPAARVRTPIVWSGDRWSAPEVRRSMIAGMNGGGGGAAPGAGRSSLCRSLNAGVAAAGGRSTAPGLDPSTWGC